MNADIAASIRRATEQLTWLTLLANTAENHFWNTLSVEFENLPTITSNPRDIADDFCAGAEASCEAILREIALCTGATHTPLDWSSSVRTLGTTSVTTIAAAIRTIMSTISALSAPPVGGYTQPPISGAGGDLYEQAADLIGELGPKFPSPITCFYPDAGATGITLEIEAAATAILKCTLTGSTPVWPDGASWHQLAVGDTVIFTTLSVSGTGDYVDYVNVPLTISESYPVGNPGIDGDDLYLVIPDALAAKAAEPLTGGEEPGDIFVLRKYRGAEA